MITAAQLRDRTYRFALRIVRFCQTLPATPAARALGGQLLRAGTSVAANYRAACRSRSRAEFIAKIGTVTEEADESILWLKLLVDSGIAKESQARELRIEGHELVAIFVASQKTAKANREG